MPPQQTKAEEDRVCLCAYLCILLLMAGDIIIVNLGPQQPSFTVASLSISGGQVAFNVSDRNPNRHSGIYYKNATWASLLYNDTLVASGQAIAAGAWYQPSMNTTSIAGVLDVVDNPSYAAALRAGRLPLRLQLTTAVSFRANAGGHSGPRMMKVNCDVLVGAHGSLLRDSVGAPCDTYVGALVD